MNRSRQHRHHGSFPMAAAVLMAVIAHPLPGGVPALDWPERWTVFGPVSREAPVPDAAVLASVPTELRLDGKLLHPGHLTAADGEADLAELYGKPEVGRTAYVFVPFTAAAAGRTTLGFGADWWFEAFLDGQRIADTLDSGNASWPPNVSNVQVPVDLSAGQT